MKVTALNILLSEVQPGFASGQDTSDGTLQVRMNNVGTDGSMNWEKTRRVPVSDRQINKYHLVPGDVLFNNTNSPSLVGKTALFQGLKEPVVFSNHFLRIQTKPHLLDSAYLVRWFNHLWERGTFKGMCTQWVNQASVRKNDILSLQIPLPPLDEQKRIAAILDKADAIRRKRAEALKLTDQFLQSLFLDMFGDPVTNPMGWEKMPLGSLCTIRRGASPRPISAYLGGTVPWIKIGDCTVGSSIYVEETKEKIIAEGVTKSVLLQPGALIFANCGVSLGFARILKISGCIHDGWLSLEDLNPRLNQIFLLKMLNSITNHFRKIAPDGTQPNLNTGIMKAYEIPVPPSALQTSFAAIVEKHGNFVQNSKHVLEKGDDLFGSCVQQAFRGEL